MPLATPNDIALLQGWGFLDDYAKDRKALIPIGMSAYRKLASRGVPPNEPSEVEEQLTIALLWSTGFRSRCYSKKYARPSFHYAFAKAMARYILDKEWDIIILGTP